MKSGHIIIFLILSSCYIFFRDKYNYFPIIKFPLSFSLPIVFPEKIESDKKKGKTQYHRAKSLDNIEYDLPLTPKTITNTDIKKDVYSFAQDISTSKKQWAYFRQSCDDIHCRSESCHKPSTQKYTYDAPLSKNRAMLLEDFLYIDKSREPDTDK